MANIAIITNFQDFREGYSLTGIVKDQARMLTRFGNRVFLYVSERYRGKDFEEGWDGVTVVPKIPFAALTDYMSKRNLSDDHKKTVQQTSDLLVEDFTREDITFAFTHDFIFTGWNLPYGLGIMDAGYKLPGVRWLNWIHSIPSGYRDYWDFPLYGPTHTIIYPNKMDIIKISEQFRTMPERVRCIPHIKDMRTFFDFDPETCRLIDDFPGVMQNEIIQIYPASGDRLFAKRVDYVIRIFGHIKNFGHSVFLLIANQWATTTRHAEDVKKYVEIGEKSGLVHKKDFVFTSEWDPKYRIGLPRRILRELMMFGNTFFFPTEGESFGLVLPEASLSGAPICTLNLSLPMQIEVSGGNGIFHEFGSHSTKVNHENEDKWLQDVALLFLSRYNQSDGNLAKTFYRRAYNMDRLYAHYYAPVMQEAMNRK